MGKVVQFKQRSTDPQVLTCGCGCQEFGLVVDDAGTPDLVYCYGCQMRIATVTSAWTPAA